MIDAQAPSLHPRETIGFIRGVIGKEPGAELFQSAWVRTLPTTVLGHDITGDVKSTLNLSHVSVGDTFPREKNSKGLSNVRPGEARVWLLPVESRKQ